MLRFFSFDGYALGLGKIHVIEVQREFEAPTIQHLHQANFGGMVEFLVYDLGKTELSSGDVLPLTLYWRALEQMDTSYTVFTAATGDRLPVLDEKGENVVDDRVLLQKVWVITERR